MFELTLKQTHWLKFELTLKQTHNENGSVTRTKPQEIMVRSQPQRPTPLSDSPAAKDRFFYSMMLLFFVSLNFISKLIWKLLVTNPNAQGSILNNGVENASKTAFSLLNHLAIPNKRWFHSRDSLLCKRFSFHANTINQRFALL